MQNFKGDELELKFDASAEPIMTALSTEKTNFFNDAYACFLLGELLYDNKRAPLTTAIKRTIFREAFSVIFDAFRVAGSFEGYLTVFRDIFGDDVTVVFTVPAPGKLQIDIEAAGFELSDFVARHIDSNTYLFDEVMETIGGDNIAFQTIKGFTSQYELEQMLFEMVPDGIYTEISLTVGP